MGRITDDEMQDARQRLGLHRAMANDPLTNYMTTTLRTLAAHLEDALHEERVDEALAQRIIHRVIWGGMPHAVDATVRMDMMAERINRLTTRPVDQAGDPIPFRASPTEASH